MGASFCHGRDDSQGPSSGPDVKPNVAAAPANWEKKLSKEQDRAVYLKNFFNKVSQNLGGVSRDVLLMATGRDAQAMAYLGVNETNPIKQLGALGEVFRKIDVNSNGQILENEFFEYVHLANQIYMAELFDKADKNGDGKISIIELNKLVSKDATVREHLGIHESDDTSTYLKQMKTIFDTIDQDTDGTCSKAEFVGFGADHAARVFRKIDKNHDGKVSRAELIKYMTHDAMLLKFFQITATNSMEQFKQLSELFEALDYDSSNGVTLPEWRDLFSEMEKQDKFKPNASKFEAGLAE